MKTNAIVKTDDGYVRDIINGRLFYTASREDARAFKKGKLNTISAILTEKKAGFEIIGVIIDDDGNPAEIGTENAANADLTAFELFAREHVRSQWDLNRAAVAICTKCPLERCVLDNDDTDTATRCPEFVSNSANCSTRDDVSAICSTCGKCADRRVCKTAQTSYAIDATDVCQRHADRVRVLDKIAKARGLRSVADVEKEHDERIDALINEGMFTTLPEILFDDYNKEV